MSGTIPSSGPATPGAGGGAATAGKAKRRKHAAARFTPKGRTRPLYRYEYFLRALQNHLGDPGFPNFFQTSDFVTKLQAFIDEENAIDKGKFDRRGAVAAARAGETRAGVIADGGEAALVAFYGPTSSTLAEFGIKPRRPQVVRRRKKGTHGTGGGGGGASGVGAAGGGGSGGSVSDKGGGGGGAVTGGGGAGGTGAADSAAGGDPLAGAGGSTAADGGASSAPAAGGEESGSTASATPPVSNTPGGAG